MNPQDTLKLPSGSPKKKRALAILLSVVVILVISGVTAGILHTFNFSANESKKTTTSTEIILVDVDAPEDLIAEFIAKKIESRDSLYTKRALPEQSQITEPQQEGLLPSQGPTNSIVTYPKKGSFSVQVSSSDYVQYERKNTKEDTNDVTLSSETDAFLKNKGLIKIETTKLGDTGSYIVYDSKNVVCEVDDFLAFSQRPSTYGVACVAKKVIDTQYAFVDSLLKLVPNIDTKTIQSVTTSIPVVENSKQLITMTIVQADKAQLFYFATLEKNWEYIGTRPITNADDTSSFALPDELRQSISNMKWNGFLEKYIK